MIYGNKIRDRERNKKERIIRHREGKRKVWSDSSGRKCRLIPGFLGTDSAK